MGAELKVSVLGALTLDVLLLDSSSSWRLDFAQILLTILGETVNIIGGTYMSIQEERESSL